jgi:hypothetical protein
MSGKKVAKPVTWSTADGRVMGEVEAARLAEDFESDEYSVAQKSALLALRHEFGQSS